MCNCLSFLLDNPTLNETWVDLAHSFSLLCRRFHSWSHPFSSTEIELFRAVSSGSIDTSLQCMLSQKRVSAARGAGCSNGLLEKCGIYVIKRKRNNHVQAYANGGIEHESAIEDLGAKLGDIPANDTDCQDSEEEELIGTHTLVHSQVMIEDDGAPFCKRIPKRIMNGGDDTFSLFTQQGFKGTNQDSMLVWENFLPSENTILCGVFDGHGPHGHHISRNVRDALPAKLASCWQALKLSSLMARKADSLEMSPIGNMRGDPDHISLWEETFHNAHKLMDKELLIDEDVDCVFSGTTAVTLVKQGNDLIIANVGDSRAVLGVKFENSLLALQLTVDLTPNLPKEAERIRRCKGRVLALCKEPFVKRVWLPHENTPGLAMARAFGDYILKNHGVISAPEVTHRRISNNDKFVVLATDGVWDVLSNEQVVHIVDSTPVRSLAAQAVVDAAVRSWKVKYPDAKADDCAVVCLFLTESWQATNSSW
eukprot:c17436_g1_i1 orf=867-2309(-)